MINSKTALLISAIILFSCKQSLNQEKGNRTPIASNTVAPVTNPILKEEIEIEKTKSVYSIIAVINNIYNLKTEHPIDTIKDWNTTIYHESKYGPDVLDLSDLDQYYRYLTFQFLVFKNDNSASTQFKKIINESKKNLSDPFDGSLYWHLFSKSGSAYTLYKNMIIYHLRRCSYNENIETPREEKLNSFLFDNTPPNTPYFVRVKCGWGKTEIK